MSKFLNFLEFEFPSSFTSAERAFVHEEARERGLLVRNIG